jgi:peptide-N4-(N-acetyl-beta-glucosaminyl)asparagine amidase
VRVGGRWVHLDPCEAAVDQPLLYQSWGKNQTYILAYSADGVEDVTLLYTSDHDAVGARRTAEGVTAERFARCLDEECQYVQTL